MTIACARALKHCSSVLKARRRDTPPRRHGRGLGSVRCAQNHRRQPRRPYADLRHPVDRGMECPADGALEWSDDVHARPHVRELDAVMDDHPRREIQKALMSLVAFLVVLGIAVYKVGWPRSGGEGPTDQQLPGAFLPAGRNAPRPLPSPRQTQGTAPGRRARASDVRRSVDPRRQGVGSPPRVLQRAQLGEAADRVAGFAQAAERSQSPRGLVVPGSRPKATTSGRASKKRNATSCAYRQVRKRRSAC